MNTCAICGYPIMPANVPMGYAGPTCPGHYYFQPPSQLPAQQIGSYSFTPTPLTADEVRKIIREELERACPKPTPEPLP